MTQQTDGTPELNYSKEAFEAMHEALKEAIIVVASDLFQHPDDAILKLQYEICQKALTKAEGGG